MSDTSPEQTNRPMLLMAVVQSQDADAAESALCKAGFTVGRLPSAGGFLGRRNITLLIGLPFNRISDANDLLNKNCRQRIEYVSMPIEGQPLPIPSPIPITVGGATIFVLEIDQYMEVLQ